MSLHFRGQPCQVATNRWDTIRFPLDSTARTIRLCIIVIVATVPLGILGLLSRR